MIDSFDFEIVDDYPQLGSYGGKPIYVNSRKNERNRWIQAGGKKACYTLRIANERETVERELKPFDCVVGFIRNGATYISKFPYRNAGAEYYYLQCWSDHDMNVAIAEQRKRNYEF